MGWPEYEEGTEHVLYHLPHGKAKTTVELPFYTVWKTQKAASGPDRLHARNQTRQGDGGNRGLAPPSRRRSTKKPKNSNGRNSEEAEEA